MKRSRVPWLVLAAALVLVAAVMGWVTHKLVALEHDRLAAERRGAHEEQVRLALWRVDSAATAVLLQEIAALGLIADPGQPAPPPSPEVRGRFVLPPEGTPRSADGKEVEGLTTVLADADLWSTLPAPDEATAQLRLDNPTSKSGERVHKALDGLAQQGYFSDEQQEAQNRWELSRRVNAVDDNMASYGSTIANVGREGRDATGGLLASGPVRPLWVEDDLLLVRRVERRDGPAIHGVWLDWPALRERLLAEVGPALPDADLVPVRDPEGEDDTTGLLATLPVRLLPGRATAIVDALGPLWPSLALGWAGMLAAALAVFVLLRWSLALSERRAAFVSAVTHELRTPLTTFRMYAEMLEEGMVDEAKRTRYVSTLRREADRLGELVENVLTYARIESDRMPLSLETMTAAAAIERARDRLADRATAAGLELDVDVAPPLGDVRVCVDPSALEQILFNLVDNAAKYGPSERSPRIEIDLRDAGTRLAVRVRDHGPGIPAAERRTIFAPFAKGAAEAAGSKPGVGLGLALSRRLARQLGGDLDVEPADPGARFVLGLPRA